MKQGTQRDIRMGWPPSCDRCGDALKEPGAVAFGPPVLVGPQQVTAVSIKHHLCHSCWGKFKRWLGGEKKARR